VTFAPLSSDRTCPSPQSGLPGQSTRSPVGPPPMASPTCDQLRHSPGVASEKLAYHSEEINRLHTRRCPVPFVPGHVACLPDCGQSSAPGMESPCLRTRGGSTTRNRLARTRLHAPGGSLPGGVGHRKCGRNFRS
jgi:hypothetical protein